MIAKRTKLADLYEADETAWLDAMAELIRRGDYSELDYEHLQEYLSDMSLRERRAVESRLEVLIQRVEWSTDRSQVRLEGIGCWIEMQVDAQAVHVSADIPVLGRLLGGSVTTRLKEILERTFQHKLPGGTGPSERVRP